MPDASQLVRASDCKQCGGYLIRLGSRLTCGFCGWPEDRDLPEPEKHIIPRNDIDALRQRVSQLEAENASLKQQQARETKPGNGEKLPDVVKSNKPLQVIVPDFPPIGVERSLKRKGDK